MKHSLEADLNATVTRDDNGTVRAITFADNGSSTPSTASAKSHVRRLADKIGLGITELSELDRKANHVEPKKSGPSFHLADKKTFFDTTTYVYAQTYLDTPIWGAGITATINDETGRILSIVNSSKAGIDAKLPPARDINRYRKLFCAGESGPGVEETTSKQALTATTAQLTDILGSSLDSYGEGKDRTTPELISGRFYVYQLDRTRRQQDHPELSEKQEKYPAEPTEREHLPTLPLAKLPDSLEDGSWHLVAELIIRLPYEGHRMNWRLLVSVATGDILYLRALTSHVNGLVFTYDPITSTGDTANDASQGNAVLNPLRDDVELLGLDPAVGGTQSLSGEYVQVTNVHNPNISPPTQPEGADFDFDVRTDEFLAVNTYFHNDRFFRLVEELGFPLDTYFDGTIFPINVDHRGFSGSNNGHCIGDGDGIEHACYGRIDNTGGTPTGNASDWYLVLHELGGHGILYDHVNSANFGFAHSAGDSFGMILNDPYSGWHNGGNNDRFMLWPYSNLGRRSDRDPANGWGWGGTNDVGSYSSEQILSTTLFRVYRSIGGDSDNFTRREFSAHLMAYLMLRAVGTLSPATNPNSPAGFLDALLTADAGDWTTRGVSGGAYAKVLEWSFERQDLNDGDPPLVDVYIDDGRDGEYEYLANHRATTTIWNRHQPDGGGAHQDPVIGTNYAYVRVRNRGSSTANQVNVRGFHCKPLEGHVWPVDFKTMDTTEIGAPSIQPNDVEEIVVGPFAWVPNPNEDGDDSIMMVVSAEGDPDNADKYHGGRTIEDWRLVPNDNNIAIRTVQLRPRLVTVLPDAGAFMNVCVDTSKDMILTLSNSGFGMLSITNIVSNSGEFIAPGVNAYPIVIDSGDSIDIPIRFQPTSFGNKTALITVFSNDPGGVRVLNVSGRAEPPRLVSAIADNGDFGKTCVGDFTDKMLTLSNSAHCPLTIQSIASSSAEFVLPSVQSFPIMIGAGDSLQIPIRFQPSGFGAKAGTLTINSDDPQGPKKIHVTGTAPSGRLSITGSTCIGGVKACCVGEQTLTLVNTGHCPLHVTHVGLVRPSKYWKLVNNPFPAMLQPGTNLDILIRYKAEEKCPRAQGLVIKTDDPESPKKTLDLLAYTVWEKATSKECGECGCSECCCDRGCTPQSIDACCFDEDRTVEDDAC
ncbi:MAG: choice-of-anchor D domain-containing protein [Candidatus Thiodiazotropha sp. (ex Lucinoma borealis)]|nr:choice-of-anchor D domain-containing protein [Candidatus Thiodiazotropha sp. (ex Lucinoma borealis)]